jgi:Kef-type K+ transport system membrane component KefB
MNGPPGLVSVSPMLHTELFLLQIGVIVAVSRLTAWLFGKIGQPRVVGEMAAGIALGPTIFGALAPGPWHALFPADSLGYLNALSQVGLAIFIFLIGVRVDFDELRHQGRASVFGSITNVIVPLLAGLALSPHLFARYGNGSFRVFALFIGTAMSVTAFPVLARILAERKMLDTRLGTVAIACAAVSDLIAWILLAVVVSIIGKRDSSIWRTLILLVIFGAVLWGLGKILRRGMRRLPSGEFNEMLIVFVVVALLSGAAGEWIGVHSIVGVFAAGLVTPREFRAQLIDKLETVTLVLLMPLFFALTGIRTNLIFSFGAYADLALILMVATASKWGGAFLGARAGGMRAMEASQLGVLMNARGLVELIVLNVGLESGLLSPTLFSMMVSMALFTTFITSPLLNWLSKRAR